MIPPQLRNTLARLHHMLGSWKIAARGIGGVHVQIAAKHQTALVGLTDIEMTHAETDHMVNAGLQPLGHEGLQDMAFDRQA